MDRDRWVKVHTIESIFEEDALKDALDRESIEYSMKEYKDTAYDGLFVLQKGYAGLFVREEDEARARAVIKRIVSLPYVVSSQE